MISSLLASAWPPPRPNFQGGSGEMNRLLRSVALPLTMFKGRWGSASCKEDAMAMVTDPVCGMRIDSDDPAAMAEHDGKTYYFCS